MTPNVGDPATIHLFTDAVPAVVVKVNARSVVVRRVEVIEDSRRRVNDEAEPYPCLTWDGDVSKPIGEPERFRLVAPGQYRNGDGSIRLFVGKAIKITDYRE